MHKIIVINSKDRNNHETTDTGSFKINFDNQLYSNSPLFVELTSICLPKSYFNIDSNNNTFNIDMQGDAIYTITIDEGFYSLTSLLSTIETELNTFDGSYTNFSTSYNSTNQIITISSTTDNFKLVNSNLLKLLGIYNTTNQSYGLSQLSNGAIQFMSKPVFLYLDISEFPKIICNSKNTLVSSFLIPLNNTSTATVDMESNVFINNDVLSGVNSILTLSNNTRLHSLEIKLLDENENTLNLNNSDYYFVLKFSQ